MMAVIPLGERGCLRATSNLELVRATPGVHLGWLVGHPIGEERGAATHPPLRGWLPPATTSFIFSPIFVLIV
jgi:hypothetical protein